MFYHLHARHTKHRLIRLLWLWFLAVVLVWIWYCPTVSHAITNFMLFVALASLLAGWTGRKRDNRKA